MPGFHPNPAPRHNLPPHLSNKLISSREYTVADRTFSFTRFDLYPLDSHNCKLLVHSSYDASTIYYHPMELNYDTKRRTIILEYAIGINPLEEKRHKGTFINYVSTESRGGLAEKTNLCATN